MKRKNPSAAEEKSLLQYKQLSTPQRSFSLNETPGDWILYYICPYLSPREISSLADVNKKLRMLVVKKLAPRHPELLFHYFCLHHERYLDTLWKFIISSDEPRPRFLTKCLPFTFSRESKIELKDASQTVADELQKRIRPSKIFYKEDLLHLSMIIRHLGMLGKEFSSLERSEPHPSICKFLCKKDSFSLRFFSVLRAHHESRRFAPNMGIMLFCIVMIMAISLNFIWEGPRAIRNWGELIAKVGIFLSAIVLLGRTFCGKKHACLPFSEDGLPLYHLNRLGTDLRAELKEWQRLEKEPPFDLFYSAQP